MGNLILLSMFGIAVAFIVISYGVCELIARIAKFLMKSREETKF